MLYRVGGVKLMGKMSALFFANAPLRLLAVEDGLAKGELDTAKNAAHSLKSSAGQMGAVELQRVCDELESACAVNDVDGARALLAAARGELPAAVEWITNWRPE